jgi:hypothetical protein
MSLSSRERESKARMLVNPPDPSNPYSIPSNVGIVDRASIESQADIIRRQNAVIARLNPPATPPETQEPSTSGGKRRKSKRSKKNKKNKKNKSKRKTRR